MEYPHSTQFDIFDIYRSFCDIKSGEASIRGKGGNSLDDESERAKLTREALTRLLKSVESRFHSGMSIFDELMSSLNLLKNRHYNISEDTWQQVLVFCRCVHESLEGYDPKGAWPVLIDDFIEHMNRFVLLPATSETSHI